MSRREEEQRQSHRRNSLPLPWQRFCNGPGNTWAVRKCSTVHSCVSHSFTNYLILFEMPGAQETTYSRSRNKVTTGRTDSLCLHIVLCKFKCSTTMFIELWQTGRSSWELQLIKPLIYVTCVIFFKYLRWDVWLLSRQFLFSTLSP